MWADHYKILSIPMSEMHKSMKLCLLPRTNCFRCEPLNGELRISRSYLLLHNTDIQFESFTIHRFLEERPIELVGALSKAFEYSLNINARSGDGVFHHLDPVI